jgi:hypothetical protein
MGAAHFYFILERQQVRILPKSVIPTDICITLSASHAMISKTFQKTCWFKEQEAALHIFKEFK